MEMWKKANPLQGYSQNKIALPGFGDTQCRKKNILHVDRAESRNLELLASIIL